jgi:ABC-type lipoprotein export system ATPase subunit
MSKPLLSAKGLHKSYRMGREDVHVLRGASLEADAGEFLVVMGSSGSGKSTLLHILGALDAPDRGTVEFRGQRMFEMPLRVRNSYRNRDVGFVFQFYHLLPELNVLENVLMPSMVGATFLTWRSLRGQAQRNARELLEQFGLSERLKHRPNELSGGERQRVAIARALVNRPALLLADEPTGNLDEVTGAGILRLLSELNKSGQTIVMVTHDAKVASLAHRRVHLGDGVVRDRGGETGGVRERAALPTKEAAL